MTFAFLYTPIDPVAISLGPLSIRWYALAYIAGLLSGWAYAARLVGDDRLWGGRCAVGAGAIGDAVVWMAFGIIIGGRLGHVLFYDAAYYVRNPVEILAIWRGGMAFHGGLLGAAAALWLYCRRFGAPFATICDLAAASTPFGIFFGRLANYVNAELWGRPTDVAWAVIYPWDATTPRHPSQIYEALLEGVLLFCLLRLATHRFGALRRPGVTAALFAIGYGVARCIAEGFRVPDGHLLGMTLGTAYSLPMIVGGAAALIFIHRRAGHG